MAEDPLAGLDEDFLLYAQAFTKELHRDVYPSIDPTSPALSQAGKVVIITGASKGLGRRVRTCISISLRSLVVDVLFRDSYPPLPRRELKQLCSLLATLLSCKNRRKH